MKLGRLALAEALVLLLAACGGSPPPRAHAPAVTPTDALWTQTLLDDALVTELDGCHVRSETTDGGEPRVRERWEAPGWSFTLSRDAETVQARVRVTSATAQLDAFAVIPVAEAPEPSALLAALAHPRQTQLPESSRLTRVYREERDGEVITFEEFGGSAYRGGSVTREQNDGETFEIRAGADLSVHSRAWVDAQGRHRETRARPGVVSSTLEERNTQGQVVAEHHTMTRQGVSNEWTTRLTYDDSGHLTSIDDETIEVTVEGDTTRTCTQQYCVRKDAEGRVLAFGRPDSEPTITVRRDELGRVVEVQRLRDDETRTTTVQRNADGHVVSLVADDYAITGEWDGDRLTRASTLRRHEGEMLEAESRVRTYDEHGRLIQSVFVDPYLGSEGATPHRSEMRVSYAGCDSSAAVLIESEHLSSLESPFELD